MTSHIDVLSRQTEKNVLTLGIFSLAINISGGTGTRYLIFGYPESAKKWVEGKLAIFLPYMMIFQSFNAPSVRSTLKNHQI